MSPAERTYVARLQRRASSMEPELSRRLLAAYDIIRRALSEQELARAINAGRVDALINEMLSEGPASRALASLRSLLDTMTLSAAQDAAADLPSFIQTGFRVNYRLVEIARRLDTKAVDGIREDLATTLRLRVADGLAAGKNPRTIARSVRDAVGLSPAQEGWATNFRKELESGDRAALRRSLGRGKLRTESGRVITRSGHAGGFGVGDRDLAMLDRVLGKEGTPLRAEQVDRMVAAYEKRLRAWNAETLARTHSLQAQKATARLNWEDAIERGIVNRSDLRRTWLAVGGPSGDGRNRPEHLKMHGETVGFDEPFSNGDMEPGEGDYNCRCRGRVFVARAQRAA